MRTMAQVPKRNRNAPRGNAPRGTATPHRRPPTPSRGRDQRGRDREGPAAAETTALGSEVRLQKVLARAGIRSRRGSELLIQAGRVRVNNRVVTELGTRVNPAVDRISVDGRPILLEAPIYIVLHKPDAVVSSGELERDERGRSTVVSLIRGVQQRVFPIGRLDFHTRGVLLLTNDGDLSARLLHPRYKVPKTYHVKFQGRLTAATLQALEQGVTLDDGTVTAPLEELLVMRDTETNMWVQITLTQGLYRQIRRMGEAVGHPVLKLLRVAFADITTDGLPEGEWRHLRESEVGDLKTRVGLA